MSLSSSTLTARSNSASLSLKDFPYLQRLERLQAAYPALKSLLNKLRNHQDEGRRLVAKHYADSGLHGGSPGRCAIITFQGNDADHEVFDSAEALSEYFTRTSYEYASSNGTTTETAEDGASMPRRRLFILEDMDPSMVDVLGRVSLSGCMMNRAISMISLAPRALLRRNAHANTYSRNSGLILSYSLNR